ncbi:MAG TPA: FCD domain-containing protein [Actinopolymorphaceae bacterium]|jgi:GntR family transcriptional repressor for pyruvate dehydrogenase complex
MNSRAHEEVIDQITHAIRAGYFAPGDSLPHLDELAQSMGVSKPTVGEALKVLSKAKVIETRRGSTGGVIVVSDIIPIEILGLTVNRWNLTPVELLEARRPIELELARLAGQRATPQDFELLEDALEQMKRIGSRKRVPKHIWAHYDHRFHYLIGRAARSEALAGYQHQILEQLVICFSDYFARLEDRDTVVALHRETLDALLTRDMDIIEKAVNNHLAPLERYVAEKQKQRPRRR